MKSGNSKRVFMAAIVLIAAATCVHAEPLADEIKALANLGPGVHKIKRDDEGALKSCVVVGQARISTALGLTKGVQTARTGARLNAEKEFVKWFKTNVRAIEYSGNQQIVMLQSDGQTLTETGKAAETSAEAIVAASSGAIRGLTVLGVEEGGTAQTLTTVLGWTPENAAMSADAQRVNETGEIADPKSSEPVGTPIDTTIPSKTSVSEEAGEYL